ncbi:hypothetical protein QQ054_36360 [Oscillatoria amoena NRMC-F 0135]|nr:hypothetical protein [Oscillatoria amoena NRMC-F 0135]
MNIGNKEGLLAKSKWELITLLEKMDGELTISQQLYLEIAKKYREQSEQLKKYEVDSNGWDNTQSKSLFISQYPEKRPWVQRILFLLKCIDRPLQSSEMIQYLIEVDRELKHSHNQVGYFSAFLSKGVKYGLIIPYTIKGIRGSFYLLREWVDKENTPLPEYRAKIQWY